MKNETFNSLTHGKINFEDLVEKIIEYIKKDPHYQYDIVVGSDSQNHIKSTYFVTAIIIHKKGAGGIFFWKKMIKKKEKILRNRMYEEANLSMETANKLMNYFKTKKELDYNLEIHVDIGPNGKTKHFINEIVGMLKGVGFTVKIKPESYGASNIADRYTKNK